MPADMHARALREAFGCRWVAGVDEVGRGPLAGPVVAAAVVLDDVEPVVLSRLMMEAGDSKALKAERREVLAGVIQAHAHVSVGQASVHEIDTLNIRQATLLAMRRAVEGVMPLTLGMGGVVVDGRDVVPGVELPQKALIKGDSIELCVACASLVAKVFRDRLMAELAKDYPGYGWDVNAGYGTPLHMAGLDTYGVTPHHRVSFAPVRERVLPRVA